LNPDNKYIAMFVSKVLFYISPWFFLR